MHETITAIDQFIAHHSIVSLAICIAVGLFGFAVYRLILRRDARDMAVLDARKEVREASDHATKETIERQERQLAALTSRVDHLSEDNSELRFLTMSLGQDVERLYVQVSKIDGSQPSPTSLRLLAEYRQRKMAATSGAVPGTYPMGSMFNGGFDLDDTTISRPADMRRGR